MIGLFIIGVVLGLISGIWLLVVTFRISVGWGILSFFLPIVSLVFVVLHWEETKKPFLLNVFAIVLCVIAVMNNHEIVQHLSIQP